MIRPEFTVGYLSSDGITLVDYRTQEQSSGVITLNEDDPDALDEMFKYLYTLSDHIKAPALAKKYRDKNAVTSKEAEHLIELAKEVRHLARVLVTADKYCLPSLVKLAFDKVEERVARFRSRAMILNPLQTTSLISAWCDALYLEDNLAALQECQTLFAGSIVDKRGTTTDIPEIEGLIAAHPKLGLDLLKGTENVVQAKQKELDDLKAENRRMFEQLPRVRQCSFIPA